MITMHIRRFTLAAAANVILFAVALHAQPPQKLHLGNGSVSGFASIETGGLSGTVSAYSAVFNAVPVTWFSVDLCRYNPDWEHRYCIYATGAAPAGSISSRGFEHVEVSIPDISIYYSFVQDCTSGFCTIGPSPPMAFRGTWTKYAGDGSSETEQTGTFRNVIRYPWGETASFTRSGVSKGSSANFTGALGTLPLERGGMFGGASIGVSKGSSMEILRTRTP